MKKQMEDEALILVMVEDVKIVFRTVSRGISGFPGAVEDLGDKCEGASVADGAAGKAVALLCVDSKI